MRDPWISVAVALAVWSTASLALARAAESRAMGTTPPLSWNVPAALALATLGAIWSRATPGAAVTCGLACIALVAAADSDARTGYLFDTVTFPAAVLTTLAAIVTGGTFDAASGVVLLVGGFGAIVFFSKGRLMGLGDVKAMFALGAAFGPLESLIAIFAACLSGIAAVSFSGNMRKGARIHFGPHLAAGSVFALVAGDPIVHRLMGL
jgi:prepilin signal peptidase PulO-like enzyme (type II secretory pathway)